MQIIIAAGAIKLMYKFKYPSLISIFVTNNCNLRCRHCCFDAGATKVDELSTKTLFSVIDKIASTGIVCLDFSGGETFLRNDLLDAVEYAYKTGIKSISIATNALSITEEQISEIKRLQNKYRLLYLRLSLDGAQQETHEWLRGANTFQKTLQKLEYLKSHGINLRELNTVVYQKNYDELYDVVCIAKKLGIKTSVFLPLIPVGRAKEIKEYMITPEQWKQLCIKKKDMEKEIGIEIFADSPVSMTLDDKNFGRSLPCMCGYQFLGILPNGEYTICPIVSDGNGNIFEQDIGDFWENSVLLNKIRDIDNLEGKCSQCKYKQLCRGGCRGFAHYYYDSFFKPDPLCWVNQ